MSAAVDAAAAAVKKMVKKAVDTLFKYPDMNVPAAMRVAEFTKEESRNPAKQMAVRRAFDKKNATLIANGKENSSNGENANVAGATGTTTTNAAVVVTKQPKLASIRMKSKDMQVDRANKKLKKNHEEAAHIRATQLYAEQKGKMSAEQVSEQVKLEFDGVAPSAHKIRHYVNNYNIAGAPPLKMGAPGKIPKVIYDSLCIAFESYISINQVNGTSVDNLPAHLLLMVNSVMGKDLKSSNRQLLNRLLTDTALNLCATKLVEQEERRNRWTTHRNLSLWFDGWAKSLVDLGFATWRSEEGGEIDIPIEQLARIMNFDETCLSHDGSANNRGGRPPVVFFNPHLPKIGRGTYKSSASLTMITGSTAAGEALPPHFQFQTAAKSAETQRARYELVQYFHSVYGKFGFTERQLLGVSIGFNEKGGMDEAEFEKYVSNSILPLYPDARDRPGLRVMVKVDSGPGRINGAMLARLKTRGFYLFPGVPNTTAVSQETDRNYGPFKSQFKKNLDQVVDERIKQNKLHDGDEVSVSLPPYMVGLMVFGGTDPATGFEVEKGAFEAGFSPTACKNAWAKVGAAPLTRKCLDDPQVRKTLGEGSEEYNKLLISIQLSNDIATEELTRGGFKGNLLKAEIVPVEDEQPLTEPNTQDRVNLLYKASTAGKRWHAMHGDHLMTGDFFKSLAVSDVTEIVSELNKRKASLQKQMELEVAARAILSKHQQNFLVSEFDKLNKTDLQVLMRWYGLAKGKALTSMSKPTMLGQWKCASNNNALHPPPCEKWTDDDEAKLKRLQESEITMDDTAVGRFKKNQEIDFVNLFAQLPREKLDEMLTRIENERRQIATENGSASASASASGSASASASASA